MVHYYEDKTGFVDGFVDDEDGRFCLSLVFVYPHLRGEGYGHELMKKIPQKAKLVIQVVREAGTTPPDEDVLQQFYEGHRFVMMEPESKYMIRD